ncbi:MAG: hypothetical protein K2I45_01775 [Muribaculaceae bacterium]|nr:hypothetical protein [Muribaculaceae bacterium]
MDTEKKDTAVAVTVDPVAGNADFLKKSGWTFCIIGIIAFIIGLLVDISGIWITGCTAIASGVYLLIKGKQQLHADAQLHAETKPS